MSNAKTQYDCKVIQDLLPLYQDQVCSESSKKMVEEHLKECDNCRSVAANISNTTLDDHLIKEKNGILQAHMKKEQKKTVTVGMVTAGILMVPLIICLICNLAVGHSLDWFFIVLTSLLVFASVTVVPLVVQENKGLWTLGGFTASLLLLLMTTCLYSGGSWFFVAAVSCVFGLSVIFMPYVAQCLPLPEPLSHSKGLLVMLWDTLWLYGVIVVCGFYAGGEGYWSIALNITTFLVILPWLLFAVMRYLKVNPFIRSGISIFVIGIFGAFTNQIVSRILHTPPNGTIGNANLSYWGSSIAINSNISLLILVTAAAVGLLFIVIGIITKLRKDKHHG